MFGPLVGGFALRQKGTILAGMTLRRRHELNRTMPVFRVVPDGKLLHPFTRLREIGKRAIGVGRRVLQGLEQSLRIGKMCSNTFPLLRSAVSYPEVPSALSPQTLRQPPAGQGVGGPIRALVQPRAPS